MTIQMRSMFQSPQNVFIKNKAFFLHVSTIKVKPSSGLNKKIQKRGSCTTVIILEISNSAINIQGKLC